MRVGLPAEKAPTKPEAPLPLGGGASALAMVTGLSNKCRWFYPPYLQLLGRGHSVAMPYAGFCVL